MARTQNGQRTTRLRSNLHAQSAKFSKPYQARTVPLQRLYRLLESLSRFPVVWVSGVPGAGKTAAVAGYWDAYALSGAWMHIDADDNDPVAFFGSLRRVLRHMGNDRRPLPLIMRPEHLQVPDRFGRRFFRDLYARLGPNVTVVLDDYHIINQNSAVHAIIAEGADEIPAGSQLIIVSRSIPPPPFSRLIARSKLGCCTDDDLRLSVDETRLIVQERKPAIIDSAREVHALTRGWVAGIVLLLHDASSRGIEKSPAVDGSVFDFFAEQVLKRLEPRSRAALLHTAYLPYIDTGLAKAVSGDPNVGSIVASAFQSGLFIDRHSDRPAVYRYHPLFRIFLQQYGETELGSENQRELIGRTANALLKREQINDAIPLLMRAEQWLEVCELLLRYAPQFYRDGRRSLLHSWINRLPEAVLGKQPWLLFWRGMCLQGSNEGRPEEDLERAMSMFRNSNDACGMAMTASALIETHILVWSDYNGLTQWTGLLEDLLAAGVTFPSLDAELLVRSALFGAVLMHQPNRGELEVWAEKLVASLHGNVANDTKLSVARALCLYCLASGNADLLREIEAVTLDAVEDSNTSAINRIWFLSRLGFGSQMYQPSDYIKGRFARAREIAYENGTVWLEQLISLYSAWTAEAFQDSKWFDEELERARKCVNMNKPLEAALLYYLEALLSGRREDLPAAVDYMLRANASFAIAGANIGTGIGLLTLTVFWLRLDRIPEAMRALADANRNGVKGARLTYLNAWLRSAIDLKRNRPEAARTRLLSALALAPRSGLEVFLRSFTHAVITPVCVFALEQNIHPQYIKRVISLQQLRPPAADCEHWPWRLRIFALGRFVVEIDQQPLTFERRIPRKQILLLKAIVAAGGVNVATDTLAAELWPDAEGDSAASIFEVTLSRLRQICTRDCLLLQDGQVSLNRAMVSLDVWQFDTFVKQCRDALRSRHSNTDLRAFRDRLFQLYAGHLLPTEADQPWLLAARERIKSEFLQIALSIGQAWQSAGLWDEAIGFYERVLAIDILSEEIHRRLMLSYLECDRNSEALAVYKRLQKTLTVLLGAGPSPETRKLVSNLME